MGEKFELEIVATVTKPSLILNRLNRLVESGVELRQNPATPHVLAAAPSSRSLGWPAFVLASQGLLPEAGLVCEIKLRHQPSS